MRFGVGFRVGPEPLVAVESGGTPREHPAQLKHLVQGVDPPCLMIEPGLQLFEC